MKIWIKYLIGIALGFVAAMVVPFDGHFSKSVLDFLTEFAVRFGRYTILPVMFFGVSVAVFRLRTSRNLIRPAVLIVISIVASALVLTLIGLLSILIVRLPRIPIPTGKMSDLI
ncbi:MAG: dicarboxylate/amino acid:cation symporter, partial [Spirochaetaceae bacterium]|nr:dicarboxylate/amino acid:cation symporter [Spirochaetaceae bacterium]